MMKKQILNAITQMRIEGKKPTEIANTLGISVNTVKSHIRRHPEIPNTLYCLNCEVPVPQNEGRKVKKAFMAILRTGKAAGLEYTDSLWNGLIDHVTVYADERLVFTFKNGKEIAEQL